MPTTARDHSQLHRAVVERLRQCAPGGAEPAAWIAARVGMECGDVAAFLTGTASITVDAADELLRACCGEDLLTTASRAALHYGDGL